MKNQQTLTGSVKSLSSVFVVSAETYRDRIAFHYFDGSWKEMTYGEFYLTVQAFTLSLKESGLKRGDRAAVVSENRPEWCAAYIAILMCGGIVVPLDAQLGSDEIGNLLADSGATIVCHSARTLPVVMTALVQSSARMVDLDQFRTYALNAAGFSPQVEAHPDDIAAIIYTSGTTGNPKGVMLSHRNLCADAEAVIEARVISAADNVLALLPLHHTYPCMCSFIVPLAAGATIVFAPGLKAADLIAAIRERGVTAVVAVPRLLEMIRDGIITRMKQRKALSYALLGAANLCGWLRRRFDINLGKLLFGSVHKNFGRLRFFACGGAKLDPRVMEDLEGIGFTVLEGYGLSETSPVITFNPFAKRKPGSAGRPLPGVEIRIAADGEILVKGPMVMEGYYNNPGETAMALKDGWLMTGDTGFLDPDGYLFVMGRKKEVIVLSSGKNVYPEEVEKAYSSIPLIKEICVLGVETRGVTESLRAVIVPDTEYARRSGIANIFEELRWKVNEVSMRIPEYMRIRGYTLHAEPLPRTPLGKLRRFLVQDMVKQGGRAELRTGEEDRVLQVDETTRRVVECIRTLLSERMALRASDNLELDLGFDSLKRIELVSSLESAFSITLPETFVREVQTVADVISRMKGHLAELKSAPPGTTAGGLTWRDILLKELSPDDRNKVGFSHGPIERAIVRLLFMMHKMFFKCLFRVSVKGSENLPVDGPFVIAPNHASYLDGFVIAAAVSFATFENLSFVGLQRFFSGPLLSRLARIFHVIPLDLDASLARALQLSAYSLRQKKALCIFPEGGRSFDGRVMEFKKGIGVLAVELHIPVIPTFISGSFDALPRGARFVRPAKITASFGRPLTSAELPVGAKPADTDVYQFFADVLREQVVLLSQNR